MGGCVLYSASGTRLDAPQFLGDASIHQLDARLELDFVRHGDGTRMRIEAQEPPWKVIRAFPLANKGTLAHIHNVSGGCSRMIR